MKPLQLFSVIITVSVCAGCYEVKQDDKGRTVKVNKLTGELSVIEGDKILKLKGEKEVKAEQEAANKLSYPRTWPDITLSIGDVTIAKLITKWSEGIMYYQFFTDKNLRGKGYYFANLSIQLNDNASFLIEEIQIPLSSMTGQLGLDGKTIESMEHKGQKPMSEETYKKITGWNVTWSGFNK